jgi:hypothetical protein
MKANCREVPDEAHEAGLGNMAVVATGSACDRYSYTIFRPRPRYTFRLGALDQFSSYTARHMVREIETWACAVSVDRPYDCIVHSGRNALGGCYGTFEYYQRIA